MTTGRNETLISNRYRNDTRKRPGPISRISPGTVKDQPPLMSLAESGITCHTPATPLPAVVSGLAPLRV